MHRSLRAFTLLELIVVIVILGLLALMAVPTFGRVIERSKEETTATTLKSVAREAQALSAFDQAPLNADIVEAAIKDTYYALSSGTNAAGAYVPVQSTSEDPQFGEMVYTITPQGAVLSLRLDNSKVCVLGLTSRAIGSTLCVPGVASEEGPTNTAGDLMGNGDVEVIPGLPATPNPGTPDPSPTPEPSPEPSEPAVSAPGSVSNLSAAPGSASVTLTWTKPENSKVDSYVIIASPASSTGETFSVNGEAFTVTGLSNDVTYTFSVSAKNTSGTSETKTISATPVANPATVAKNFNYAGSITHLDGFMYVADQSNNAVKAVNLTTGVTTVLASVTSPQEVATDGTFIYVRLIAGTISKVSIPANRTNGTVASLSAQTKVDYLASSQGMVYTVKAGALQALSATGVSGPTLLTYQEAGIIAGGIRGVARVGDVFYLTTNGGVKQYDISSKTGSNLSWTPVTVMDTKTVDGPAGTATFGQPFQVDTDGASLYVSGYGDRKIRKVDLGTGYTTTLASVSGPTRSIQVVGSKIYYIPMAGAADLLSLDK